MVLNVPMKAIISHDVDHITVLEHWHDLIVPKAVARSAVEFMSGYIGMGEFLSRNFDLLRNKWQNIDELIQFNREKNVPATFFIAVNNGVGLAYNIKNAGHWMKKILLADFRLGIHGISYDNFKDVEAENSLFNTVSGLQEFGIRMHYLRNDEHTLDYIEKSGYKYDTSLMEMKDPYKVGAMWEFPLHIMDGRVIEHDSKWQNQTLDQAKELTKKIIEKAVENKIEYLTILFHDRYFCESFKTWKEWYIWLINWLIDNNIEFIDYENAITMLETESILQ